MNEFPVILVTSCGSSPIRFSVFNANDCEVLMSGIADSADSENALLSVNRGEPASLAHYSYRDALKVIVLELEKQSLNDNMALIDHRIVHDGSIFTESAIITGEVTDNIRHVSPLASLHNYANLSGVESAQQLLPGVIQVAVLDTSFHQTMAPETYLYDLPREYYEELGVRRYGFHGTSHRYVPQRAHPLLNLAKNDSGLAVAHFGSDVSVYAARSGQSIDTSMGMTPPEGLMIGIRSDGVDFGAMSWAASQTNQSLGDLEHVMNKESGLLGISGLSLDLRVLEKAWHEGHERAQLAIKTPVHWIARHIIGHIASLYRLDETISTDGIGENLSLIHRLVMEHLAALGVGIDTEMNNRSDFFGGRIVPSENARVICAVIPINGEKMIALDVIHLGKVNTPAEFA